MGSIVVRQIKHHQLICPMVAVVSGQLQHVAALKQCKVRKSLNSLSVSEEKIRCKSLFIHSYKVPFVDNTPLMRPSKDTAASRALANALKVHSAR